MLWKCGVGPFYSYLILLINLLHAIASKEFRWMHHGHHGYTRLKYGVLVGTYYELMCTNLTASSFAQCPINEKQYDCHSHYCTTLHIYHSELYTINKTIIPCYLYNLTLINDHIQNIVDGTFDNIHTLNIINLGFNELEQIKKATFSTLRSLKELYLNNNMVHSIDEEAFTILKYLEIFNLSFNKLQQINRTVFSTLQNLKELDLKNNMITSIDEGAFKSLKSLQLLHLNNNKLQELSKYIFTGLDNLKELYLQENLIKSISSETFLDQNNLGVLDLTNNTISVFGSESFAGLINLQTLLLNNNFIKTVPLGTFKNFPHLTKLQLGNNFLSQFKTGTFSNLGELKHLNLSYNNFFTINQTLLYPLEKLSLLDLNNNHFTYINYTSLLLHLPNLYFISINDNNWSCQLLTDMLKAFRARRVDYLFNTTKRFTEENVDGIYCTDNPTQNKINFPKYNDSLLNKTDSNTLNSLISLLIANLTALTSGTQNVIKESIGALSMNITKYLENVEITKSSSSSSLYIIQIVMVLLCSILICATLLVIVCKKYLQNVRQNVSSRSEIELLNTPS